jgi:predicted RNase H-like HicB family nuclease
MPMWPTLSEPKGVIIGEGQTYEEALADVRSAISFHLKSFGQDAFGGRTTPL